VKAILVIIAVSCLGYSCSFRSASETKITDLLQLANRSDSVKDVKNSIRRYTAVLHLDSTNQIALINRGRALVWSGQVKEGLADYDRAINLYPSDQNYCRRGSIFIQFKQFDKAMPDILKAIEINPAFADAYYQLGLIKAGQDSAAIALALCNKADLLRYDSGYSHLLRSIIFNKTGDVQGEINEISALIKIDPSHANYYNNRGYAMNKQGRFAEGISDFNTCIRLDSSIAFAYNNKGFALFKLGDVQGALEAVNASLALDGSNAYAFKNRAEIWLHMKSKGKALADLDAAAKLNRDSALGKQIKMLQRQASIGKK
jgi:tetratricopeptide (TPR) repeat protein